MTDDVEQSDPTGIDEMGPVDYLVVEFPGNRMTGEGLPLLVDLVDRGIIRILDFAFVMKETDGTVHGMAIADFDGDGQLDLAVFEGASSGLLDEEDLAERWGRAGARVLGRRPRLRERVGRAPRPCPEAQRRAAGREWSHSCPGPARRGRSLPARFRGLSNQRKAERCQDLFAESREPLQLPARPPPCPTGSPAARPDAGPSRTSRPTTSSRSNSSSLSTPPQRRRRRRKRAWTTSWPSSRTSRR